MSTNKYHNGLIYKIVCKDSEISDIYVGSTVNFTQRKDCHKSNTNNINSEKYNLYVYKFIRDNGNWDNWEMIEITKYTCESKLELEMEERRYMELLKSNLNKCIPTRTKKEWRQNNKEKYKEYKKKYRANNKNKINEKNNKYYQTNKKKLNQKFNCECGGKYTDTHKSAHFKTKKHQDYIS